MLDKSNQPRIDLSRQGDVAWDAAKEPLRPLQRIELAVKNPAGAAFIAQPHEPRLRPLRVRADADGYARMTLPPLRGWAVVWLPDEA